MGRGLSELQKAILKLSWAELEEYRRAREELDKDPALMAEWLKWYTHGRGRIAAPEKLKVMAEDNWRGAVFFSEVFKVVYGWTPKPRSPLCTYIIPDNFSKKAIGEKKYMAAYIAVRKAAHRLEARGLINVVSNRDYYLTQDGIDLMAKLAEHTAQDTKDATVKLRYLRDVVRDNGELMHPKGKIIEASRYDAKRMMVCGLWEVVT
jgi:hypothetical protein